MDHQAITVGAGSEPPPPAPFGRKKSMNSQVGGFLNGLAATEEEEESRFKLPQLPETVRKLLEHPFAKLAVYTGLLVVFIFISGAILESFERPHEEDDNYELMKKRVELELSIRSIFGLYNTSEPLPDKALLEECLLEHSNITEYHKFSRLYVEDLLALDTAWGYSDSCPVSVFAGDGVCDEVNNVPGCWDAGDCCDSTCVRGGDARTARPDWHECGYDSSRGEPDGGYDCKDPKAQENGGGSAGEAGPGGGAGRGPGNGEGGSAGAGGPLSDSQRMGREEAVLAQLHSRGSWTSADWQDAALKDMKTYNQTCIRRVAPGLVGHYYDMRSAEQAHGTLVVLEKVQVYETFYELVLDYSGEPTDDWIQAHSRFFATTILTTIGYGSFAPITQGARLFLTLFTIPAIVVFGLFISHITDLLKETRSLFIDAAWAWGAWMYLAAQGRGAEYATWRAQRHADEQAELVTRFSSEQLRDLFNEIDEDGSGLLGNRELWRFLQSPGLQLSPRRRVEVYDLLTTNGTLEMEVALHTFTEWVQHYARFVETHAKYEEAVHQLRLSCMESLFALLLGMELYHALEDGVTRVDAIYYSVITLTTVGLGDFVPSDGTSLWVWYAWVIYGLGIVAQLLGSLSELGSILQTKSEQTELQQQIVGLFKEKSVSEKAAPAVADAPPAVKEAPVSEETIRGAIAKLEAEAERLRGLLEPPPPLVSVRLIPTEGTSVGRDNEGPVSTVRVEMIASTRI